MISLLLLGAAAATSGDAARFEACAVLALNNPARALDEAGAWRLAGGGVLARQCLGLAYAAQKRWQPAAAAFEQAARAAEAANDGRAARLWAQAGNAALAGSDAVKAGSYFDAALASAALTGAEAGEAHLDRARARFAAGDNKAARNDLNAALRLVPADPLGWLLSRGHVSRRQYDAGERLRHDWERAQLGARVTMSWDAAPVARGRGGSAPAIDLTGSQLDAKRRFEAAVAAAGPGLADILWRVVCGGEGMRSAETALGWPARAGKLVLTLALDRVAAYYRM